MFSLYLLCIGIFTCTIANCAKFYMDDGDDGIEQSLPFFFNGHRVKRFRAQMLGLMGLKRPSERIAVQAADQLVSSYMSMLYKASEGPFENHTVQFNPNFRFLGENFGEIFMLDYQKTRDEIYTSDTIISFVPKKVASFSSDLPFFALDFEFDKMEVVGLRLIGADLHCVFELFSLSSFPTSLEVLVSLENGKNSEKANFDFSTTSNTSKIFFSLNILSLLNFRLEGSLRLWIRFLKINGENIAKFKFSEMHFFVIGFFIEGEREVLQRVRRSFAFEVEENWDDEDVEEIIEESNGSRVNEGTSASAYVKLMQSGKEKTNKFKKIDEKQQKRSALLTPDSMDGDLPMIEETFEDDSSWGLVSESESSFFNKVASTTSGPTLMESFTGSRSDSKLKERLTKKTNNNDAMNENLSSNSHSFFSGKLGDAAEALNSTENFSSPTSSRKLSFRNVLRNFRGNRRCRVRSLYVDFKDLGWDGWIIAPAGYQADYCVGDCSFPLDSTVSPTNHAIVQTLMHLFDDKRAVPAKCAPIAMRAQSLLFFNSQKNVVMRRYQHMRVKQCGCR